MFQGSAEIATKVLASAAITDTTSDGDAVDVSAYEGDLIFIQNVGTVTSGTITTVVQHSTATGSGWANVTGGAFTAVTTANDPKVEAVVVSQNAVNQYVRVQADAGTAGSAPVGVVVMGRKKYTA